MLFIRTPQRLLHGIIRRTYRLFFFSFILLAWIREVFVLKFIVATLKRLKGGNGDRRWVILMEWARSSHQELGLSSALEQEQDVYWRSNKGPKGPLWGKVSRGAFQKNLGQTCGLINHSLPPKKFSKRLNSKNIAKLITLREQKNYKEKMTKNQLHDTHISRYI